MKFRAITVPALLLLAGSQPTTVTAQQPTAQQALALKPVQPDVPQDLPPAKEIDQCSMKPEKGDAGVGWVVLGPGGETLRRFLDSNADNKVDLWRYYERGIETYRDMDTDFDGTADQYRWLGNAGTRWGLDPDQDGKINAWKMISPQEVSAEVVAALREGNSARLEALYPTDQEIAELPVGDAMRGKIQEQVKRSRQLLPQIIKEQKIVGKKTEWVNFGGTWPGVVPASEHGGKEDLLAFENVLAIVDAGESHQQVPIGTLLQVGPAWRLLSAPAAQIVAKDDAAAAPMFFHIANTESTIAAGDPSQGISDEMQKLVAQLEKLDAQLSTAKTPESLGTIHADRAKVLAEIVKAAPATDREIWIRQLLDTVSAAVQTGAYADGLPLLEELAKGLAEQKADVALTAHAQWLAMSARYAQELAETEDFPKVQTAWQEKLEKFVADYPKTEDCSEVMLQLAMAKEFVGEDEKAAQWYARIGTDFAGTPVAEKAAGAEKRLKLTGQPFKITGKTIDGKSVDTSRLQGKWVLIHYWASWCEPCKKDIEALTPILAANKANFVPIGICLDELASDATATATQLKMTWPQLHEPGALESRLAKELGVFTLPVMILVDPKGVVVNRNIHIRELEAELQKRTARK